MVNWHARVDGNNDVRFMDVSDVLLFIIIFLRLSLLFWSRLRCFSTILVRLSYEWVVNNVMHGSDMMFCNHVMARSLAAVSSHAWTRSTSDAKSASKVDWRDKSVSLAIDQNFPITLRHPSKLAPKAPLTLSKKFLDRW